MWKRGSRGPGAIVLLAAIAAGAAARAQSVLPVGLEFQVNTVTTDTQTSPAICGSADGRFVAVWDDGEQVRIGIFAQRYASEGTPVGSEFQVNTHTEGQLQFPSVCCDVSGNFAVTWQQEDDQDGDGGGVFGQRFTSDGGFVGTEFQVNTYTTDSQGYPAACCGADGDFVVGWESYGQDGDRPGIFGQRFASNGGLVGVEFQINTSTVDRQAAPSIGCDAEGNFAVVWSGNNQDGDSHGIFGQRFAADATPQGSEFRVNTFTAFDQRSAEICLAADGDFAVAWESVGQDGSGTGIFGQRFASTGTLRGGEFQASATTAGNQQDPAICCGSSDDFVIAWDRAASGYSVFARRFGESSPLGGDVPVSFPTEAYQTDPAIVCQENGGFVVVWEKALADGDEFGIFGRRFALGMSDATPVASGLGLAVLLTALVVLGLRAVSRRA